MENIAFLLFKYDQNVSRNHHNGSIGNKYFEIVLLSRHCEIWEQIVKQFTNAFVHFRYYECEILTPGTIKIGWQLSGAPPDHEIGGDEMSWAYDGFCEEKVHAGLVETYGKVWHVGDVVGVFLDTADHTISKDFSLCLS